MLELRVLVRVFLFSAFFLPIQCSHRQRYPEIYTNTVTTETGVKCMVFFVNVRAIQVNYVPVGLEACA